jgi:hypothetical protein
MHFEYWNEGVIFIGLFLAMVGIPCFFTAILGVRLIDRIGQYPSRSTRFQLGICIQLFCVEILGFAMQAAFFRTFSN